MNKSYDQPPPYNELIGSAPDESSLEFSSSFSTNDPSASRIGFENINNTRNGNPTLLQYKNFNVRTDTEAALVAMKSPCQENLAELLSQRTALQREEIANLYFQKKNKSLVRDIKKQIMLRTPGLVLVGLSVPYYEYLARSIHNCQKYEWLNYLLFTIPKNEMEPFKNYFEKKYGMSAKNFLLNKSFGSSDTRYAFDSLKKVFENTRDETNRNKKHEINDDFAKLKQLDVSSGSCFDASELEILNEIFLTKSFSHIKQVCEHYEMSTGTPIQKTLQKVNDVHNLYNAIAEYALNPSKYFATILYKHALVGPAQEEYLLSHIFVWRSEIDLYDIKMEYNAMSEESLSTKIKERFSKVIFWVGPGKHIFLQLLGEPEDWSLN